MPDMVAIFRAPGPSVHVLPRESVTLETHDMALTRKESGERWALVLRSDDPEDQGRPYNLLCTDPGCFYKHPTDWNLYLTLFDSEKQRELERYTIEVIKLTKRLIRESLGIEK